jgi:hypothetical protein
MRTPIRAVLRLALAACVGLAGTSITASQSRAAAVPENSLPNTTVFFAKVDDCAAFRDAFAKTSFGQMLSDPAMKDLKDDFKEKLADASKQLKEKVGVTINELLTLPQGPVAVAIVAKSDVKMPVALVIHADAGKNAEKMTEVLSKATKLAETQAKDNAKVSTETFKGLTLHIISSGKENDPPLVWTNSGSIFHITSDLDVLKDLISHADGRDDSLAKSESFRKVTKKLGTGGQALWFIDIAQIVKVGVKAAAAGGNAGAQNPEAMLQILGLNNLKAAGGTLSLHSGNFDGVSKTFVLAPGPAQGLLKLFTMPKANLRPEPWVPATVSTYQTISWDLDGAYTAINDLANTFQPGVLNVFEQQLVGPNGGEPLSFQKDIFGPLGDRITIISDFKKPIKEDSQRMLIGVALEDAKKFQATLNKLIALANGSPKKREFQGTTIYDFAIPELPNQAPNSPLKGGTVSLAISKDTLFVSTEPGLLELVLRGGGATLGDTPEFQRVTKDIPSQTSTLTFAKSEDQARASYDMIKSGAFEKAFQNPQPGAPDMSRFAKLINKDKLPEFSVFAKYLNQGGGYGVQDEDGMVFTSFSLRKANP